jgi:hypothetical protein
MAAKNPIATIVNQLGYKVDVYDVYKPSEAATGLLQYTKLATVPSGATGQQVQTIRVGSQLQAMRTGSITALNGNYYEQFPVAVLAVLPFDDDSNTFTLTSDLQLGMEASFKFIKYTQANPSSQLAKSFRKALGDKKSQKTAVNKFFADTGSFKQCTLATWTAVFTWQAQFTSAWQGTYYLYSLGSSSSQGTTAVSAPALVATLAILSSAQGYSAVLTMAGTDDESTTIVMTGDGTMQEVNAGTGNLSVVLTPSWLNVTQTSQKDGTTVSKYVIGAAFTGTINGMKVAGNLNQLVIPDPSSTSTKDSIKNNSNSLSLSTLTQLVGMLTGIGMLYYMAKGHKQAETKKLNESQEKASDKNDAQAREQQVENDYQQNDVPKIADQVAQADVAADQVPAAQAQVNKANNIQKQGQVLEEQIVQMEQYIEEKAPSATTQKTVENLVVARNDVAKAVNPSSNETVREAAMEEATTTLSKTGPEISKGLADEGKTLSKGENKLLKEAKTAIENQQEQENAVKEADIEKAKENQKDPSEDVNQDTFDNEEAETSEPVEAESGEAL